jgi:hypothetical protein
MPEFHCDQGRKASPNRIGQPQARLFATREQANRFIDMVRTTHPTYEYHLIKRDYGKYEVRAI